MIKEKLSIKYNPNSDAKAMRSTPTTEEILEATEVHNENVSSVLNTLSISMALRSKRHDWSIHETYDDYVNAFLASLAGETKYEESEYLLYHALDENHHLSLYHNENTNLFDLIEYIVDQNVMRRERNEDSTSVEIPDDVLREAFENTCKQVSDNLYVTI